MIAWGVADSVVLRRFLGLERYDSTRDQTTISLRRGLINMETHRTVFDWVLKMSTDEGLLKNNRMSMDARTLEANAPIPRSRTVRSASRTRKSANEESERPGKILIHGS